jgi:hypothetical protein
MAIKKNKEAINMNTRAKESGIRNAKEYWKNPENKNLCDNPFPINSENYREWNSGFVQGSKELQLTKRQ